MVKLNDIFDEFADEFETPPNIPAPVKWEEEELLKSLKQSVDGLAARVEGRRKTRDWMTAYLTKIIKKEIEKVKPQEVIERQVEQIIKHEKVPVYLEPKIVQAPPTPPQIIRETRVEVQVPEKNDYVEKKAVEELKAKISEIVKELEETSRMARTPMFIPGGSGVIGVPVPEGTGKILSVVNSQWKSKSFAVENVTSDPVNPEVGQLWLRTDL